MPRTRNGLLLILLVGALIGGGFLYSMYRTLRIPATHRAAGKIITIPPGTGSRGVIEILFENGVISNRYPALVYLTVNPVGRNLQAGDYEFESPISPIQALDKIRRGQVATRKLTIREGSDIFDITKLLPEKKEGERIAGVLRRPNLIKDLDPEATTLEGYVFPDTYILPKRATNDEIVAETVARFHKVFTPEMRQQAKELGLTVRQVMTLASMIEKEAANDAERPLVSSVFHNRLKKGMRMECDPTFMYAAELAGTWDGNVNNPVHRRSTSPYNTYVATGLPPGPIACPGQKSIEAALNPAQTTYLFFVLGQGGRHKFSSTAAEHEIAVAEYRKMQREKAK